MLLPYLKEKRWPRVGDVQDEKSFNLSTDERLQEHCAEEMWAACETKDAGKFRQALRALMHSFHSEGEPDGD